MAYIALMISLSALLVFMGWVGWRYFVARLPIGNRPASRPSPLPGAASVSHAPAAGSALPARLRGLLYWTVFLLLIAGSVAGGVFWLSEWIAPEPLAANEMDRQAHIQAALNPESLAPPPALPPSMFIGSERPALETADRDWSKLDPRFAQSILKVMTRVQSRGYLFALLEGYRSPERQDKLAQLGGHVTNATAFQSKHQFGLAADLAPLRDGKLVISERDPWAMRAYTVFAEEAESLGLAWGGRWWFKDYGHIESADGKRPSIPPSG